MKFGVVVFPGSNCDHDAFYAIGNILHKPVEFIWHQSEDLGGCDAIILPGGFAHGDYLRTGAIARFSPVMKSVEKFAKSGGIVLGICNGFQILQAEGVKQSEILKAEGDAQARVTRANAEAEAIRLVSTAAETFFKDRAEVMRRLDVLNNTLAQNTKYIVPSNSGLLNVLGLDSAAGPAAAAASAAMVPPKPSSPRS